MRAGSSASLAALGVLVLGACATGNRVARLEVLLARHDSATVALEAWCRNQGIADPTITAQPVAGPPVDEPGDLRARLGIGPEEPVRLRHVRLSCGGRTQSQALNWYVPARLTPAMNAALASTATPFGKVAAPLDFRRERIDSRRGGMPGCPANTRLAQRAVLRLPGGAGLALVVECYLAEGAGTD